MQKHLTTYEQRSGTICVKLKGSYHIMCGLVHAGSKNNGEYHNRGELCLIVTLCNDIGARCVPKRLGPVPGAMAMLNYDRPVFFESICSFFELLCYGYCSVSQVTVTKLEISNYYI